MNLNKVYEKYLEYTLKYTLYMYSKIRLEQSMRYVFQIYFKAILNKSGCLDEEN